MTSGSRTQTSGFISLWIQRISIVFCGILSLEVVSRIIFPWDIFIWPESPFMTNLLKLSRGLPIYTSPADANSFVYSPGLDYLTFGFLKLLGLPLDIRFCRWVVVGIGLLAAVVIAWLTTELAPVLAPQIVRHKVFTLTALLGILVLFRNFTADVPHPDNLHILHVGLTALLCYYALTKKQWSWAIATVILAGLGGLTKQTAFLSLAGCMIAFLSDPFWRSWRWLVLAAVGSLSAGFAFLILTLGGYGWFYTVDLLSSQKLLWDKIPYLVTTDILVVPHRLILLILATGVLPIYLNYLFIKTVRSFLVVWVSLGMTEVLPNILPYLKLGGLWNNLGVLDVWLLLLSIPAITVLTHNHSAGNLLQALRQNSYRTLPWRSLSCLILVLALVPLKLPPLPDYYRYCRTFEDLVSQDVQADKQVLIAHGTEFWLRSHAPGIPLDRANTYLELWFGGKAELTNTQHRIESQFYDRLYLNVALFYGLPMLEIINTYYQQVDSLPAAVGQIAPFTPRGFLFGYNGLMTEVLIMEPKATSTHL